MVEPAVSKRRLQIFISEERQRVLDFAFLLCVKTRKLVVFDRVDGPRTLIRKRVAQRIAAQVVEIEIEALEQVEPVSW